MPRQTPAQLQQQREWLQRWKQDTKEKPKSAMSGAIIDPQSAYRQRTDVASVEQTQRTVLINNGQSQMTW
jgi:hypothetical protein